MVAVSAAQRRGETDHVARLRLGQDSLEAKRGQVVAFIDDHLAIPGDAIVDSVCPNQGLQHRDVEHSVATFTPE